MRGSFPAPHHHDPNKTLPFFSNLGHGGVSLAKHRRRATVRSTLPSRRGAPALSTQPDVAASLLPVVAAPVHAWIGVPTASLTIRANLASHGGDWQFPSWRLCQAVVGTGLSIVEDSSLQQATLFAHFFPERRVVWLHFCSVQVEFLVVLWPLGCPVRLQQKHSAGAFSFVLGLRIVVLAVTSVLAP